MLGDGTLIGNSCEVKNSVLMDRCQIAHFNYIGDSVLGIHAHFAAGAIVSNYKLDGSIITVPAYHPNLSPSNNQRSKQESKDK